ncbi:MAG TPA: hypothetical protein VGL93_11730 [Streptosporangiaceae bacterium]|jgi:hypothetical protein
MYVKNAALGGLGGGTAASLPFTGFNVLWFALAAFTLIAAGLALLRMLPKPSRGHQKTATPSQE